MEGEDEHGETESEALRLFPISSMRDSVCKTREDMVYADLDDLLLNGNIYEYRAIGESCNWDTR